MEGGGSQQEGGAAERSKGIGEDEWGISNNGNERVKEGVNREMERQQCGRRGGGGGAGGCLEQ